MGVLWSSGSSIGEKTSFEAAAPTGLPFYIFPDDYDFQKNPPVDIHEAVLEGMGNDWRLPKEIKKKIEELVENSVDIGKMKDDYDLSFDECVAICYYTIDAKRYGLTQEQSPYYRLNRCLIKRDLEEICPWKSYLHYLLNGLSKLPDEGDANKPIKVYRGLDEPITKLSPQYKKDNQVVWITFTSTSKSKEKIFDFTNKKTGRGTFMLIKVIEGKNIRPFSFYQDEEEVLLLPNSTFIVENILSEQMKEQMGCPLSMDGLILRQKPTSDQDKIMKNKPPTKVTSTSSSTSMKSSTGSTSTLLAHHNPTSEPTEVFCSEQTVQKIRWGEDFYCQSCNNRMEFDRFRDERRYFREIIIREFYRRRYRRRRDDYIYYYERRRYDDDEDIIYRERFFYYYGETEYEYQLNDTIESACCGKTKISFTQ